jgi:DNA-directed RNA polymerase specialized sigma24 family protein
VEGIGVFIDWTRLWTRRAVLKHAIQMIRPEPENADNVSFLSLRGPATSAQNNRSAAILSLDVFERFVFVMSILEGQSDKECARLLSCPWRDVMMARVLATATVKH